MDTGTAGFRRTQASAIVARGQIRLRWWGFAFTLALILGLAVGRASAESAPPKYTCDMTLGRSCTVTEELAFCVINAFLSYDDCKENGGFWNDVLCYPVYAADFYACYLTTPINVFIK